MKKFAIAGFLTAAFSVGIYAVAQDTPETNNEAAAETAETGTKTASELDTFEKRLSYAIGFQLASEIQNDTLKLDSSMVKKAIDDVTSGGESALSQEDLMTVMAEFQERMMAERQKMQAEMEAVNSAAQGENLQKAEEFLAANKDKEGVKTIKEGLQYKVIKMGDGEKPTAEDSVKVHYRGTLLDGTEFDSSYKRNQPATFPLNGVIPGWTEGLQHMPVGSKFEFYIHPDMAYGAQGRPGIPPNSMLTFEVELLEIVGK